MVGAMVAAVSTPALASISLIAATRTVSATASNFELSADTQSDSVTGFAPWDWSVQRQMQSYQEPAGVMQQGCAEQHSRFDANSVSFSGSVSGVDRVLVMGTGNGSGTSTLTLDFAVPAPTDWYFTFNDMFAPTAMSQAWMGIQDASGAPVAFINEQTSLDAQTGVLLPGTYRLLFLASNGWSGAGAGAGSATYNWTFGFNNIPSPGTAGLLAIPFCSIVRRRRPR
jgi:hypothetical protein